MRSRMHGRLSLGGSKSRNRLSEVHIVELLLGRFYFCLRITRRRHANSGHCWVQPINLECVGRR